MNLQNLSKTPTLSPVFYMIEMEKLGGFTKAIKNTNLQGTLAAKRLVLFYENGKTTNSFVGFHQKQGKMVGVNIDIREKPLLQQRLHLSAFLVEHATALVVILQHAAVLQCREQARLQCAAQRSVPHIDIGIR